MESSRPPQPEPPRKPAGNSRKANGANGSPTPPWLFLLVIVSFALIFYQFGTKTDTYVPYSPYDISEHYSFPPDRRR